MPVFEIRYTATVVREVDVYAENEAEARQKFNDGLCEYDTETETDCIDVEISAIAMVEGTENLHER